MWQAHTIIHNGTAMPFAEARLHPLSVAVAYGVAVFEGLRAYRNPADGSFSVFRLDEHLARLQQGMKVMRFDAPPSTEVLREAVLEVVRLNAPDDDAYIRLQAQIETLGTLASTGPVGWVVAALPRERSAKFATGLAATVSSWIRISDNAMPPRIKASANYHASRLANLQARADGYDSALLLTQRGKLSEAASACIFLLRDGVLVTPGKSSDILESVTRETVLTLAAEAGLPVEQRDVDRTELYVAEEVFLCGTGQELVAVTSVDRLPVGDGRPGAVTQRLQSAYEAVVRGTTNAHPEWRARV
ncbi:branched-chain-amino-acid transaminase [Falsiroseomonas tokyonensis]|uniref:Branched-chain-amino-acid aminotransferase n=1 Tax=Falsiroseomonas tokyonensis TaxID=430521 RepID=A0ABV7BTN7_9PROT|nr:branched-chain-amino-acid transaminase [Falsiroseomonas tokyonensis]MBU8539015.1 branched-chain-amino-acid transaminase [Falsiroseomonas tokyonensis]